MTILDRPEVHRSMRDKAQPEFFSIQIARARRFHLCAKPPAGQRLCVICGGCEHCAPNYEIHRSQFPYLALEFVAGGRGQLTFKNRKLRLVPGTLFTYGQGVAHDIVTDSHKPLVKYFVDFAGKSAIEGLRAASLSPGTAIQTSAPNEVMTLFDNLVHNGLKATRYSQRICVALLDAILLKIAETRVPIGSVESSAFGTYQNCLQQLEESALRIRTLQELAEACKIDQAYLCRLFRRFGHESPYQCLLRLKMNHAAARLQTPGILVKQVATELGFNDPYHFSRVFKSVFGISPAQFVQRGQSDADASRAELAAWADDSTDNA